jgi:hypothetical protein
MSTSDREQPDAVTPHTTPIGPGERAPPFESGNTVAVVHGTYSAAEVERRAARVHDALLEIAPWVAEEHYAPSVDRYLKATAREQLAHEALIGMTPGAKGFTRLLETATAASRLAWFMGDALGLTPGGHARLKVLVAAATDAEASIADLAEEGRRIRLARGES